ncbi:MAG: hypothetical protein WA005_07060 [Candidatus Binataceae bacterium]
MTNQPPFPDDPINPPYPYLLYGYVANVETTSSVELRVLAAWFERTGRVLNVEWLPLRSLSNVYRDQTTLTLVPGAEGEFAYRNSDQTLAEQLAKGEVAFWAVLW